MDLQRGCFVCNLVSQPPTLQCLVQGRMDHHHSSYSLLMLSHFQDYMIYGMNNQVITDIKQVGQRVIEFDTKREEPVLKYYQHQDEYRDQQQYRKRDRSPSRSPPPSKRQYRDDEDLFIDANAIFHDRKRHDRRQASECTPKTPNRPPQTLNRPQKQKDKLCHMCGKRHGGHNKFSMHPDANHDPNVKWVDTLRGKA